MEETLLYCATNRLQHKYREVKVANMPFKNNKAEDLNDLPAELLKTGCNELMECMHQLIYKIWLEESMPKDRNLSVLFLS